MAARNNIRRRRRDDRVSAGQIAEKAAPQVTAHEKQRLDKRMAPLERRLAKLSDLWKKRYRR